MTAYYNEIDPYAAQWLRNLIAAGHIAPGDVDERSIVDVRADDLRGFAQCHFFAGIGGWAEAFQLAEWKGEAWTGSCPCQPLSGAGKRQGHADERHLWPAFYSLIAERRPSVVFGEQVTSKDGREWLAGVRADLEDLGYACGAADLCAAGVGAPHPRQRLYWVAHADGWDASAEGLQRGREHGQQPQNGGGACGMGDSDGERRARQRLHVRRRGPHEDPAEVAGPSADPDRLGHPSGAGLQGEWREYRPSGERHSGLIGLAMQTGVPEWNGSTIAVLCSDGPRRISAEPESFPLAHGLQGRMGRLRAYGNAIVPASRGRIHPCLPEPNAMTTFKLADRLNVEAAIKALRDLDSGLWTRGGCSDAQLVEAIVEAALFNQKQALPHD